MPSVSCDICEGARHTANLIHGSLPSAPGAPLHMSIPPDPSDASSTGDGPHRTHHAIDYIEFGVTDMARAQRFYARAFGWRFIDYGPEYAGIRGPDGGESGGFRLEPDGPGAGMSSVDTGGEGPSGGGPLVILYSRDLDDSLWRVREAGGRVTVEPFAFPGGRRFHFRDLSGNELAVWSEV